MTVRLEILDDLAIVTLDNPPVNSISHSVRLGLLKAFQTIGAHDAVRAAILIGTGRGFCAGGDSREFGTPAASLWPGLSAQIHPAIEATGKPVIAALHGFAYGGGLETALVCQARIAAPPMRLALPECRLGLIPLSGTQRLPRLASLATAVEMIVFGTVLGAEEALAQGIVDRMIENPELLLNAAMQFAHEILRRAAPPLPSQRPVRDSSPGTILAEARARLAAEGGSVAQYGALDALAAALAAVDFQAGLQSAQSIYHRLLDSAAPRLAHDRFLND